MTSDLKICHDLEELDTLINEETLLVLDVDNVLLHPSWYFAQDHLFLPLVKKEQQKGMEFDEAIRKTYQFWDLLQLPLDVECPCPKTPSLLQRWQERGAKTLGLTGRYHSIKDVTKKQLSTVGIDFRTDFSDSLDVVEFHLEEKALFEEGIIFASDLNQKGDVLKAFFEKNALSFPRIVFVDDRERNVSSVQRSFETLPIDMHCYRYAKGDLQQKNYDPEKAISQMKQLYEAFKLLFSSENH